MNIRNLLKLSLVIGRNNCRRYNITETISRAIKGGVTSVQLREKASNDKELYQIASAVLVSLPEKVPLIINDRLDIALALQHQYKRPVGVHLGQTDLPIAQAVQFLKSVDRNILIGLSIENCAQAKLYRNADVSYFGVGPIFKTHSKIDASPPIGGDELKVITQMLSPKPCIAIGGITDKTVTQLLTDTDNTRLPLAGVAVVSTITRADDPCDAAKRIIKNMSGENKNDHTHYSFHCRI